MNHDLTSGHYRFQPSGFDAPYTFGRPPSTYLTQREIVRLTILRSKIRDSRLQVGPPPAEQPEPATE
jgi:hypothetical protein